MANKIYTNHTLEKYNKKYRNCKYRLLKITKKEVEDFDKKNLSNIKGYLLKDRKWALIKDTYYEIPKAPRYTWFRNLNGAVQASICLLGAGVVGAAVAVPTVLVLNKGNSSVEKYNKYLDLTDDETFSELESLTTSEKETIKKSMVVTVEDGSSGEDKNYTISFNKDVVKKQVKVSSVIKVKVGNQELVEGHAFTYALKEDGSLVVTISKSLLEQYGSNVKITPKLAYKEQEVKDLILPESLDINVGEEETITAHRIGSCTDPVIFAIEDIEIVQKVSSTEDTVKIKALKNGTTNLNASWNGLLASCVITVEDSTIHVQSISCNSDLIMNEQETIPFARLGVTVTPTGATEGFSVEVLTGEDIVEIDNENKTIYSKKAGTATLKIVSDDSSEKTCECEVTVKETIKNINDGQFTALLNTFIETQEALSSGGCSASYRQDQITMSMTIRGEERDVTNEIESVENTTVFFNEQFAQEIGTDSFDLSADAHKDQILDAAQSGGSTLTQNTDTGTIAVCGESGGAPKAEVSSFGYLCCLAAPSQHFGDVRIDYNGAPTGLITKNAFLGLYDQYCQNYEESTSKYKLNNVEELTVGGETISEEKIRTLKYINTGKGAAVDCVLTAVTSKFAPGEQPIVLNANNGNYISRIGDLSEAGTFTLESDGTITYTYPEAEEGYFKIININKYGYVVECDDSFEAFSLTFNSDPVDTIKTVTATTFANTVAEYKGAFNENENEYDEEDLLFMVDGDQVDVDEINYGYNEYNERYCAVSYSNQHGVRTDIEIDANTLTDAELEGILSKGSYAKDVDDGTIYYNNSEAGEGEISELEIDRDGYVKKLAKKVETSFTSFAVSFNTSSHETTSISLNKDKLTLAPGETYQLNATVTPEEKSAYVGWTSDNDNIGVDYNGLVTVSENATIGEKGTIIAYLSQDIQATCEVTVGRFGKDEFLNKYQEYSNKFNSDSSEYTKDKVTIKDKNGKTCNIDSIIYNKQGEDRICNVYLQGSQTPLALSADYDDLIDSMIKDDENCTFSIDDDNNIKASNSNHAFWGSYCLKFNSNGYLLEFVLLGSEYYVSYDGEPEEQAATNLSDHASIEESQFEYFYADNIALNDDSYDALQEDIKEDRLSNHIFNI